MRALQKWIIPMVLAFCLLLSGCALSQPTTQVPELLEPAGVELDYATATLMDLTAINTYSSAVVPKVEELYFTVDGIVLENRVTLGQQVHKGDVLIVLDEKALTEERDGLVEYIAYTKTTYANANRSAELDAQIAQLQLEQMRQNGASNEELVTKQSAMDMAALVEKQAREQRSVELAKLEDDLVKLEEKLGKNVLVAPCDGTIVSLKDLRAEYGVSAYDVVVRIADETQLQLSGEFITESSLRSAYEVYALIGDGRYAISYLPVDMTEYLSTIFAGAALHTRFDFVDTPEGIACGDYAAICVSSGHAENALCIPVNALYSDSAGRYVYKRTADGSRVRQSVHTGMNNRLYVQITDGLAEGDQVYVK